MTLDGDAPSLMVVPDRSDTADPPDLTVDMYRTENAHVVAVDAGITELLGWRPEDLIGEPSTALIHHEDQNSAVNTWFEMISTPGVERVWRGRYRSRDGTWRWVETVNLYDPESPDPAPVRTRMRGVDGGEISIEERLREREQILTRLSDALPVGVFQFDSHRRVVFTNEKLHAIISRTAVVATTDALFAMVEPPGRDLLEDALTAVLAGRPVADFDFALTGRDAAGITCSIALRTLTSRTGEVTGGIGCVSDVTEQVQLRRKLEYRASTDLLTGCMNRAASVDCLARELASSSVGVAAVFIDLDHFKGVNDQHGHAAGDEVLKEVARRLGGAARTAHDWVGRLGGDEFLVICREVDSPIRAHVLARRFANAARGRFRLGDGHLMSVRASAGAAWGAPGTSADELIAEADRQMYLAKTGE